MEKKAINAMEEHEYLPEDTERLSRLEAFQQHVNSILNSNRMKTGLVDKVDEINLKLNTIEGLIKSVKTGLIWMGAGAAIVLVLLKVIGLKDIIGFLK